MAISIEPRSSSSLISTHTMGLSDTVTTRLDEFGRQPHAYKSDLSDQTRLKLAIEEIRTDHRQIQTRQNLRIHHASQPA
jgi:hypothetical protein